MNQTLNVAALRGDASANNAAAYSIGHQLLTSAWNVVVAVALVGFVFGWSDRAYSIGHRAGVGSSTVAQPDTTWLHYAVPQSGEARGERDDRGRDADHARSGVLELFA